MLTNGSFIILGLSRPHLHFMNNCNDISALPGMNKQ